MAVVTLADLKDQLSFTDDIGNVDDALLTRKLAAAEAHVERMLGFNMVEHFGSVEAVPAPLQEAVCQLAAWWYEQREAAVVGATVNSVPFSVQEIVAEYREYSF